MHAGSLPFLHNCLLQNCAQGTTCMQYVAMLRSQRRTQPSVCATLHTSSAYAGSLCFVTYSPASVHLVTRLLASGRQHTFAAGTHPVTQFHTAVGLILYPTLQFTRTHKTFAFVGLSPHDFRNNLYQSLPVIANGAPVMTAEQLHVGTPHEPMAPRPLDTSS